MELLNKMEWQKGKIGIFWVLFKLSWRILISHRTSGLKAASTAVFLIKCIPTSNLDNISHLISFFVMFQTMLHVFGYVCWCTYLLVNVQKFLHKLQWVFPLGIAPLIKDFYSMVPNFVELEFPKMLSSLYMFYILFLWWNRQRNQPIFFLILIQDLRLKILIIFQIRNH